MAEKREREGTLDSDDLPPCFRQLRNELKGDVIVIWDHNGSQFLFLNPSDMNLLVQGAMITLAVKQIAGGFIEAGNGKPLADYLRKIADEIEKEAADGRL